MEWRLAVIIWYIIIINRDQNTGTQTPPRHASAKAPPIKGAYVNWHSEFELQRFALSCSVLVGSFAESVFEVFLF